MFRSLPTSAPSLRSAKGVVRATATSIPRAAIAAIESIPGEIAGAGRG